ncbi:MAG: VCBS repeat-containing protein [Planctomycetes bacterium]|nr:VCBS repeat-containing protein [Planctomycetota bacterium]
MDFDGDGCDDILTGSYWPGHLYFFRGTGDGKFEKGRILEDAKGEKLHAGGTWKSEREYDSESLASVPFAIDFDGDGDLDLLVGNINGRVILIPNEGSAKKPAFDREKRRALEAGGKELKVAGDSGPVVADWDQDGVPDLVVGAGDGAVHFFRNAGTKKEPRYAEGVLLLPASKQSYSKPVPNGGAPESPGTRTKVCVADWDGDGRLDLLVGDLWYEKAPDRKLTEAQAKRLADLRKKEEDLSAEAERIEEKLGEEEAKKDKRLKEIYQELGRIFAERSKLESHPTARGSVWLCLRKKGR